MLELLILSQLSWVCLFLGLLFFPRSCPWVILWRRWVTTRSRQDNSWILLGRIFCNWNPSSNYRTTGWKKWGCLSQSFMPYVISLVRAQNHLLSPRKHRESKNQLSTQREVPRCRFELRLLRPSQLMCVSRLRLKTLERSQEVSSQKLRATKWNWRPRCARKWWRYFSIWVNDVFFRLFQYCFGIP